MKTVLFVVFVLGIAAANPIPNYIHICKRSDPDVAKCVKQSVEFLRPKLKVGIPELGVPGLEHLKINDISLNRGFGNSYFKLDLKDVKVSGLENFVLGKLKIDVPNFTYKVNIEFPSLHLVGKYDVDTKILAFPVTGSGNFVANTTKCQAVAILKGDLLEKEGKQLMHFSALDLNLNIEDYNIKIDNLFDGDEALVQGVNEIMNQNKGDILRFATPFIQEKASEVILEMANKITNNFVYDEAFPE